MKAFSRLTAYYFLQKQHPPLPMPEFPVLQAPGCACSLPNAWVCLQGALLMSFLHTPLYLSSLTVLYNLPPSAVLGQQSAAHQGGPHSSINTSSLAAVKTAVYRAIVGKCMVCSTCVSCLLGLHDDKRISMSSMCRACRVSGHGVTGPLQLEAS